MTQRFKGNLLTLNKCVNSILRFYCLATLPEIKEGRHWYKAANKYCQELASRFNISVQQAAGIVAAFSPQTGWHENKRYAVSFLLAPTSQVKSQVQSNKAKMILKLKSETDIFHALAIGDKAWKTKAFFLNICNPDIETQVTIDRHAIASCIQLPNKVEALSDAYGQITFAQYSFFQQSYELAAKQTALLPHQLQAIVWTTYRRLRDLRKYDNNSEHAYVPFTNDEF